MKRIKKNFFLRSLIIILIINAILTGGEFQYFLLFAMLTSIIFNFIYLQINKKNISHLFFTSAEKGTVGENLIIEYKLTNNGMLPIMNSVVTTFISKKLGDAKYPEERISFKPFQFTNLKHDIVLKHHGYYKLGKVQVDMKDPFNIFTKRVMFDREINLSIYPKFYDIDHFPLPHREMFGRKDVKLKAFEDFTNIKNSRIYTPGDSYKRIHWKLTAKNDQIYVKEFNLSASGKVSIYMDCFLNNYSKEQLFDQDEKIVEIAATLIRYYLKNKFEVSLTYLDRNRKKIVNGKTLKDFDLFMKALIGFAPNANIPMSQFLKNDSGKLTYGSTIVLITPNIDQEMFILSNQLIRRRFELNIITLNGANSYSDHFKKHRVYYQSIELKDGIKEKLEGIK